MRGFPSGRLFGGTQSTEQPRITTESNVTFKLIRFRFGFVRYGVLLRGTSFRSESIVQLYPFREIAVLQPHDYAQSQEWPILHFS